MGGKSKYCGKPFTMTLDERYIADIRYRLGSMEKQAPSVLANALNQTLTQLKKYIPKRISQEYTYKPKLQVPRTARASYSRLQATLRYDPIPLSQISKIAYTNFDHRMGTYGSPRNTPGARFQAKVDSNGGFHEREGVFQSGDKLFERVADHRYPLKYAVGPSETTMVRSIDTRPFTSKMLADKLDGQITKKYMKKWGMK